MFARSSPSSVFAASSSSSDRSSSLIPLSTSSLRHNRSPSFKNLDHIFGVEPLKITSPSTDFEVSLTLRVLEGCCLLHPDSAVLAYQHKAIQVLMNILPTRGVIEQGACLDALIAFMLDSSANQMDFEAFHGIEEVVGLIRDKQVDENLRAISHRVVTRCIESEREALVAFKQGLVDDYDLLSSWGREEHKQDCCQWLGVHCSNRTNHITQLHLGGSYLDQAYALQQKGRPQYIYYYLQGAQASYFEEASFIWKGMMSKYKSTLGLVKCIHLSSNQLTGEIPREITDLVGLVSLNLSRNNLTGQITPMIGKLESLESLDLSRNHIYGGIPTSLFQIYGLGYLDLSNNNLSGKIPIGTQLQTYDPYAFAGNPLLCGIPLQQLCSPEETSPEEQPMFGDQVKENDGLITTGFYLSLALGFVVGFWGVCGSLIFIRSWRYTYYKFLNYVYDWLYVRVMLIRQQRTVDG